MGEEELSFLLAEVSLEIAVVKEIRSKYARMEEDTTEMIWVRAGDMLTDLEAERKRLEGLLG